MAWCKALGWKTLLNTKGPTWRKLTPEQQEITTQSQAVAIMMEYPSVIRRPIVETESGHLLVGFDPTMFESFIRVPRKTVASGWRARRTERSDRDITSS
ncbi:MAG: ArsC/Spx/MgsR family protein [Rhodocyclaceae bacterium]